MSEQRAGEEAYRELTGLLDPPMVIVTAAAEGERSGCLVGFSTACSIDPPRHLVCISTANHTAGVAARSEHLAVHLLERADRGLSELFGEQTGDRVDKFASCSWTLRREVPVLDRPRAWFVGRVVDRVDLGDHVGHVLAPVEGRAPAGAFDGLTFRDVEDMEPGHPA